MKKIRLLVFVSATLMIVASGSNAMARKPGSYTCVGGTPAAPALIPGGQYSGLTVTGDCRFGGDVTVNGNLTVADGAILNDHAFGAATLKIAHVTGNVLVGKGAVLGLGKYAGPGVDVTNDTTVDGNIVADHPLSLYLSGITVHGSVISNGGGSGPSGPFRNFPTKDDFIDGDLIIQGWQGGWLGVIRDNVGGNVIVSRNASVVTDDGTPPPDPDSTEVQSNVIEGNLICQGNTPAAQVNPGDGGQPNEVAGNMIGECAGL